MDLIEYKVTLRNGEECIIWGCNIWDAINRYPCDAIRIEEVRQDSEADNSSDTEQV